MPVESNLAKFNCDGTPSALGGLAALPLHAAPSTSLLPVARLNAICHGENDAAVDETNDELDADAKDSADTQ